MLPEGSLNVPWRFTECSLIVPWMFTESSWHIRAAAIATTQCSSEAWPTAPILLPLNVPWRFTLCSLKVHSMFPAGSLIVHWMFTECSVHIRAAAIAATQCSSEAWPTALILVAPAFTPSSNVRSKDLKWVDDMSECNCNAPTRVANRCVCWMLF
jgi:hypothetical protein